jgi:hypothetical protein
VNGEENIPFRGSSYQQRSNIPVPDPTQRTEEASERQTIQSRRDLDAAMGLVDVRIGEIHRNIDDNKIHHDQLVSSQIDIINEKFNGIAQRFLDRDARAKDAAIASKNQYMSDMQNSQNALKEAFSAAKELQAVTSEQFKTEIAALRSQAGERAKSVDQQLAAINKSIDQGVPTGYVAGERAQRFDRRLDSSAYVGYIIAAVAIIGLIVSFFFHIKGG